MILFSSRGQSLHRREEGKTGKNIKGGKIKNKGGERKKERGKRIYGYTTVADSG